MRTICAPTSKTAVAKSLGSCPTRPHSISTCLHAVPPRHSGNPQAEAVPAASLYRRTGAALLSALVVLSGQPPAPDAFLSFITHTQDASSDTSISTTHTSAAHSRGGYGIALAAGSPSIIEGTARVSDGDTLVIGKERIRLYGMDAPEKAQPCKDAGGNDYACGLVSKKALEDKVGSQPVRCEVKTVDQYGRNVAACSIAGNLLSGPQDLGQFMVSNGLAVAYRQYGKEYIPLEETAHAAHKGIWAGSFTMPADWRKAQKAASLGATVATANTAVNVPSLPSTVPALPAAPSASSLLTSAVNLLSGAAPGGSSGGAASCPPEAAKIKGNIGAKGEKIYHVPGGRSYDQVKIETAEGERYFCTEAEAQAAGWRAAKA